MFVLFIVHNILNRRWYQTVLKGKNDVLRVLNTAVNLLLLITMAVLMVSGMLISHTVFDFIPVKGGLIARQIHVLGAYWGFILISVHLGMHWGIIINAVCKMTGITGTNRVRTIGLRILAVLIAVYGVYASFDRAVGSKLILYYSYDYFDGSVIGFFTEYLSIMGIYVCGAYYVLKFIQRQKKANTPNERTELKI